MSIFLGFVLTVAVHGQPVVRFYDCMPIDGQYLCSNGPWVTLEPRGEPAAGTAAVTVWVTPGVPGADASVNPRTYYRCAEPAPRRMECAPTLFAGGFEP